MDQGMKVNLQELVSTIRQELEELDRARTASGKPVLFQVTSLELELNFAVVENSSAKGGIDLKIVSLGAGTELKTEQIQKVKLKFGVPPQAADRVLGSRAHPAVRPESEKDVTPLE